MSLPHEALARLQFGAAQSKVVPQMVPSDDDNETIPDVARRSRETSSGPTYPANREPRGSRSSGAQPDDAEAGAVWSVKTATLPGAEQSPASGRSGAVPSDDSVAAALEVRPRGPGRRLRDAQVLEMAEGIRAVAGPSHEGDPRVFALRIGICVVPGFPEAGEVSTATEAVFSWHPERRERGIRTYCALVTSYFLDRRVEHEPGDVWALAGELALP